MKTYSPFYALIVYFAAVLYFDLDQAVQLHQRKLVTMQQYAQLVRLRPQAEAEIAGIDALRDDLLRLATSDPQASQIVAELHLHASKPKR